MAVLVALAAILAALSSPAYAQQAPIVQCRVDAWIGVVPSYACDAITHGARLLRFSGGDLVTGHSINACAQEVGASLGMQWQLQPYRACMNVFMADIETGYRR